MEIHEGTVRVVKGSDLSSIGNDAKLILGRGGTLAGGGSVYVDNTDADFDGPDFVLHGTIAPDVDTLGETHTEIDGDKRIGTLTLGGNALFSGSSLDTDLGENNVSDTIRVVGEATSEIYTFDYTDPETSETKTAYIANVINVDRWLQGKYLVVDANAMDAEFKDTFGVDIADGDSFANRDKAWLTVETGIHSATGGLEDMYLNMKHVNVNLSWTGAESNDWNTKDVNWKDRANDTPEKFENFDRVFFGGDAEKFDLQIAETVTVSDIYVHGGEYTFDGDTIKGVKNRGEFFNGELAADAQTLALWRPYDKTHRRLYEHTGRAANACDPSLPWSRAHCWELWGEASHTSQDVDSDGNALEYDVKRWGVTVGADRKFSSRFLGGMMFAYGNPKLRHQIGRVEADDYTFGLYGQARLDRKYYVNLFLGYGFQNYDYSRNSGGRAKYDGDAMYASAEFFRPIHYYSRITLFPLLAFDFQKSWADGFTERGGMIPLQIGKASMEQTMIRIGLNSRIRWSDRLNLHTRLQYGVLAGGDRRGTAITSLVGNSGISRPLYGVDLGQNRLNVGLGGEWKWTNRTRLFGDYDFDLGDRGTAHTGQFGFVTNW